MRATAAASAVGEVLALELRACGIDCSFTPTLDLDHGQGARHRRAAGQSCRSRRGSLGGRLRPGAAVQGVADPGLALLPATPPLGWGELMADPAYHAALERLPG